MPPASVLRGDKTAVRSSDVLNSQKGATVQLHQRCLQPTFTVHMAGILLIRQKEITVLWTRTAPDTTRAASEHDDPYGTAGRRRIRGRHDMPPSACKGNSGKYPSARLAPVSSMLAIFDERPTMYHNDAVPFLAAFLYASPTFVCDYPGSTRAIRSRRLCCHPGQDFLHAHVFPRTRSPTIPDPRWPLKLHLRIAPRHIALAVFTTTASWLRHLAFDQWQFDSAADGRRRWPSGDEDQDNAAANRGDISTAWRVFHVRGSLVCTRTVYTAAQSRQYQT